MKLIIDLGNTLKKFAVFRKQEMVLLEQFQKISTEEAFKIIKHLEEQTGNGKFHSVILSSVIDHPGDFDKRLSQYNCFVRMDSSTPVPLKNNYKTPLSLGTDRIAAVIGAKQIVPSQDSLVIGAGTTITYDFINAGGEYLGGGISPGINMRLKALNTFTEKLPFVEVRENPEIIGTTTEESILSGVLNGVMAEVDGIIKKYSEEFPSLKTIITGGDHKYFDKKLKNNIFAVPNLVLHGLNHILDHNAKE